MPTPEDVVLERLESVPVAEILRRLRHSRATGTLVVRREDGLFRLLVSGGRLVLAQSNREGERLGEFLVRREVLRMSQVQDCLAATDVSPFGHRLVARGLLPAAALDVWLRELVVEIVAVALAWEEGTAAFEKGVFPVGEQLFLRAPDGPMLLEAIRRTTSAKPLQKALAAGEPFEWVPGAPESSPLSLAPAEYYVISRFEGRPFGLAEAERVIPDRDLVHRTIAALLLAGWLAPQRDSFGSLAPAGPVDDEETRKLIELSEKMEGMTYYEFLGVPRSASHEAVAARAAELRRFYSDERLGAGAPWRRRLLLKLDEATAILGDAARRHGYDTVIDNPSSALSSREIADRREVQRKIARTNAARAADHVEAEEWFDAVKLLEQAIVFEPENVEALLLLARCQARNPRWTKQTVETLQKVVTLDPSKTEAWLELGRLFAQQKLSKRAEAAFQEVLRIDPVNEAARDALRAVRSGAKG